MKFLSLFLVALLVGLDLVYCHDNIQEISKSQIKRVGAVQCDATHSCPDGDTCCTLPNGQWGCCPEPNAVCCEDHLHCCPHGKTCDVSGGKCLGGDRATPYLTKTPAIKRLVGDVQCDSTHYCRGNTCCRLSSGQWGCCPEPNAVCCDDHEHCCPSGYTCTGSSCIKGRETTPYLRKTAAIRSPGVVVCPDGQSQCPSGNTCCKLSSGGYGCCPFPSAVCCSDGIHCCPNGYTCSSGGFCTKKDQAMTSLKKVMKIRSPEVVCPDGTQCPSGNTCCKSPSGGYVCCPLPNAVCCSDGMHCCPNGYTCSSGGFCTKKDQAMTPLKKVMKIKRLVSQVQCDSTHYCPSGNTCCRLSSGQWGCCPLPNAVCCDDHVHCCPSGYTCTGGLCTRERETTPYLRKTAAIKRLVSQVQCDSTHYCPSGNTCCRLSSGQWGCCPLPNAVCCDDHVHCCPSGYTCTGGLCTRERETTPYLRKTAAIKRLVSQVQCDSTHYCPSGNTCCRLSSGQWGCCPLPNAVCCDDHMHCCPSGYTCTGSECTRERETTPYLRKTAAIRSPEIVCPDGESQCPSGNTCCKSSSGGYGCCPLPNAVCCSDGEHCCPHGATCDLSHGTCTQEGETIPFLRKIATIRSPEVVCPDGRSACPSGQTCCKLSSFKYGCCPFPKAVCCFDHKHCCPQGYTCASGGSCARKDQAMTPLKKVMKIRSPEILCPDGQSQCPAGATCCALSGGGYGCCPFPEAECCSDMEHCCPHGYTCDVAHGKCHKGGETIPFLRKVSRGKGETIVCPGGSFECSDSETCCELQDGSYACCPLLNAVCCSDHLHCCQEGTTCDLVHKTCVRGKTVMEIFKKKKAFPINRKNIIN